MATLLALLTLLLSRPPASCGGTSTPRLQLVCQGYPDTLSATQPHQCTKTPCNITTGPDTPITLALPLLLSLETECQGCSVELELYNTTGGGCGMLWLWWTSEAQLTLEGATCARPENDTSAIHSLASDVGEWWHLEVVTEGQQVRLYTQGHEVTLITLTCHECQPSYLRVAVPYYSKIGYSALTTTTTTTHHLELYLCVSLSILAVVVVVVAVWRITKTCTTHGVATSPTQDTSLSQQQAMQAAPTAAAAASQDTLTPHVSVNSLYGDVELL